MTNDVKDNIARLGHDTRSTQQIIYEKAHFGGVPIRYSVHGDTRWHTVHWAQNPMLNKIEFSDGSIVVIGDDPDSPTARGVLMEAATEQAVEAALQSTDSSDTVTEDELDDVGAGHTFMRGIFRDSPTKPRFDAERGLMTHDPEPVRRNVGDDSFRSAGSTSSMRTAGAGSSQSIPKSTPPTINEQQALDEKRAYEEEQRRYAKRLVPRMPDVDPDKIESDHGPVVTSGRPADPYPRPDGSNPIGKAEGKQES